MEFTRGLAENIVKTKYEDLPKEAVEVTKKSILDTLGVMFPPSTLEKACIALEEMVREEGGKGESTLIGFGGKTSCWMAAFVNGSLCHPMDYDDTTDEPAHHPSASTFPAALAIAEKIGNISGKDFITAIALGNDLGVRLASAPKGSVLEDYPWFPIVIFGLFSATGAAGKLLGLTEDEMVNAFGIALHRASGITEAIMSPDSEIRAIRDGFTNKEGVLAAFMAKKGIAACKDAIEKLYKFFYKDDYDPLPLTSNLGKEFMGVKVSFKPWPSCRGTHCFIQAALDLAKEYDIDSEKVEEALLTVGRFGRDALCEPLEAKREPKLSIGAKLSLPFTMGVALAKRRAKIEDFLPENLQNLKVLEIASKVKYKFDPQFGSLTPAIVEIKTQDGKTLSKRVDIPYGHPQNPISDEDLMAKFKDCARYAKKTLSEDKIDQLAKEKILKLEKVKDIGEITDLLL